MSRRIRRIAAVAAPLAAVGAMSLVTAPAWAGFSTSFVNWAVSGSLTPKKLNEPVTLPKGSTFNGVADIGTLSPTELAGTVTGSLYVPPFKTSLKLAGIVPSEVGVTFTQVGASEGTMSFAPASACAGSPYSGQCATMSVTSKAIVGISVVGLLGIEVPTQCQTSEPVTFNLKATLTLGELLDVGPHFAGSTTIPTITCEGASGLALGPLITGLMSGPENPYALYIAPREPAAPTVLSHEATSISQVSARLNGNVDPNGAKPSECKFEYGRSISYGTSLPCQSPPGSVYFPFAGNPMTAQAGGLEEGATYHFRMVVTNSIGTSYSADQTFTTLDSTGAPEYGQCVVQKDGNYAEGNCNTVAEKKGQPDHKGKYEWESGPAATCVAQKKGDYADASCTTKAAKAKKGTYEQAPGAAYTTTSGAVTLETAGVGPTVVCAASSGAGVVTGTSTGSARITFTGCEMSGKKCTSEGANGTASGEVGVIVTNMLDTRLLGPVSGQVWVEFVSAEHEPYLAEFGCEGLRFRTSGSLSGMQAEDIDSSSVTSTTTFAVEEGEQALYTSVSENGGTSWVGPDASNAVTLATNTAASHIEIRP
jgi:hypothetical protein